MRSAKKLHEALILFTVQTYLEHALEDGSSEEQLHRDLVAGISSYKMMRRLNLKEHNLIVKIGQNERLKELNKQKISWVIYALQLLILATKDYDFIFGSGAGKKKRLNSLNIFIMYMLKEKHQNKEIYDEKKIVIDESKLNAKHFYNLTLTLIEDEIKCK